MWNSGIPEIPDFPPPRAHPPKRGKENWGIFCPPRVRRANFDRSELQGPLQEAVEKGDQKIHLLKGPRARPARAPGGRQKRQSDSRPPRRAFRAFSRPFRPPELPHFLGGCKIIHGFIIRHRRGTLVCIREGSKATRPTNVEGR